MARLRKAALMTHACVLGLTAGLAFHPAMAAAADATPAAADPDSTTVGELVVSIRRAEQKAVDAKRDADNEIDTLFATDVGKLPDQNVAEALHRLPGISVANDQGEGRYVIVRGVNPNLANVTVNGATAAVPEPDGRQIKLDDIPSSLIGKVQVIKSLTPDLDANAIAGQVDIDTLSAFDRRKPFLYVRGATGEYNLNNRHPYEADATAGSTFADGKFGAVLSGNLSRRPIESQNFDASGPTFGTVKDTANNVVSTNFPNLQEVRDYNLIRERKGVTANFDLRPNDKIKLYLRTLYSSFSDNETRDRFRIDNESAFSVGSTATTGSFNARGTMYVRRRREDDNTKTALAGGKFDLPLGTLVAEAGWSRAEKVDPLRSEVQFRTGGAALAVTYDVSQPLYLFTPSAAAFDPASYNTFNGVNYDNRKAVDTLKQARVDWTVPVNQISEDSTLKFGAKALDREKVNNRDFTAYKAGTTAIPFSTISKPGTVTVYDGRYALGPRIDYSAFQAFVTANPTALKFDPTSVTNSLVNDYDATEKVYSGYAMSTLRFGALTLIPGVRVEHTEGDYKAKTFTQTSTASQGYNVTGKFSYTDYFPGLNARYDVRDNLTLRAAVTTAIGRPNFQDLAPYVSVDTSNLPNPVTAALGNSNLKPLKSVNYDAAIEYYLPNHSILSADVFYKTIDRPIFTTTRFSVAGETFAGVTVPVGSTITQPTNADHANVRGIEFNLSTGFTFLPAPFDGFGVSANAAFVTSDATGIQGRLGEHLPLAMQSPQVQTIQLFYEKAGFQGRLAWSRRGSYLFLVGADKAHDQSVAPLSQLDARVSYSFKQATVFIEGSNLTDAPYRIYQGSSRAQVIENERYDYSVRTGLQLAF